MNIIVDTSVWSLVLRRNHVDEHNPYVIAFRSHLEKGDCFFLLGSILQELLDGIKSEHSFEYLVKLLKPFPLVPISRETYILAARLRNQLRKKGVQASPVDFLISAASIEHEYPLLTADHDFLLIAKYCSLSLISFPLVNK
ncbi:MAG: PIN domain-containing protein [Deltaproteobacteria bacterium]|nr:PIN domain-containing protein [Deltaproteobacteria bacterium]